MNDRLLIGVLGGRNSGKSHTWNELFQSGGDVIQSVLSLR